MPHPSSHLKRSASSRHLSRHYGPAALLSPHPLTVSPCPGEDDRGRVCSPYAGQHVSSQESRLPKALHTVHLYHPHLNSYPVARVTALQRALPDG